MLKKLFQSTLVILLTMVSCNCFAQKLSLVDIFKAYTLDTVELKSFCADKQFTMETAREDNWLNTYTFRSTGDKSISFTQTFPKNQSANICLFYYFDSKEDYKNFRKAVINKGFVFEKEYVSMPKGSANSDYIERFGSSQMQLDLCTSNFDSNRYALLLYRRILPRPKSTATAISN